MQEEILQLDVGGTTEIMKGISKFFEKKKILRKGISFMFVLFLADSIETRKD